MTDFLQTILQGDLGSPLGSAESVLFVLLLSFVLGHFIGWVYMWTHSTLSYSQTFTASLVVIPPLVALMMVLMAGSVAIAFGLLAVFAVVRFRNVLKDTRDTIFVLWSILEGLAIGTTNYSTGVTSTIGISFIIAYLHMTSFGARRRFDTIVNVQLAANTPSLLPLLSDLLARHSLRVQLANERKLSDDGIDLSYRILLRDPSRSNDLQEQIRETTGVKRVSLFVREEESEI